MKFLFVCSGNTCRSPMAEALMKKLTEGKMEAEISSCGIGACEGSPANECAVTVMKRLSVDLTKHRSRLFKEEYARGAVVLAMDSGVLFYIRRMYPNIKAYLLKEYAGLSGDIEDPYMAGEEAYRFSASQIKECIDIIMENGGEHA
ncbi:MAG: low molecular weight protein arginine phosphatase [Clostridia bacterium]|nr:low molecular weight protein arginine phosphatase [Clostridia bacterium]